MFEMVDYTGVGDSIFDADDFDFSIFDDDDSPAATTAGDECTQCEIDAALESTGRKLMKPPGLLQCYSLLNPISPRCVDQRNKTGKSNSGEVSERLRLWVKAETQGIPVQRAN